MGDKGPSKLGTASTLPISKKEKKRKDKPAILSLGMR